MNDGRFIFSQVIDFMPRYEFDKCVERYNGNYRIHDLTCYNQFLHLLFGNCQPANPFVIYVCVLKRIATTSNI